MGVTINWLWRVLEVGAGGGADVLEDHAVDQAGVFLEVHQAVAVDPEDLAELLVGEFGGAENVLGCFDDDLVGADAAHHVVDAFAALVEVALDFEGGELVGHDADAPTAAVAFGAGVAVGDDLAGRFVFVSLAEGAEADPGGGRWRYRSRGGVWRGSWR